MQPAKLYRFSMMITIFLFCIANNVIAENVAVKHGQIFIANGGLIVKDLQTGAINQCTAPPLLDPVGNDVTDLLSTATDVVIKRDYAIVTIHPLDNEGNPFVDTITVDVSSCFGHQTVRIDECISTVDVENGYLIIPCIEINGSYITVHMDRRGNSDNWKVSFSGENLKMKHYDHYHNKYHDYFDDDDDD